LSATGNYSCRWTAFIETALFVTIAFSVILPTAHLFSMVFTMTIIKVLYELIVLPITVKITAFLKKSEGIDSFEEPSWRGVFGR